MDAITKRLVQCVFRSVVIKEDADGTETAVVSSSGVFVTGDRLFNSNSLRADRSG